MKKVLTLLFAFAVAFSLSTPTFAKKDEKKEAAATSEGAAQGKKEGQQGTAPAEATRK